MAVGLVQCDAERCATGIGNRAMLRARPAAMCRIGPNLRVLLPPGWRCRVPYGSGPAPLHHADAPATPGAAGPTPRGVPLAQAPSAPRSAPATLWERVSVPGW